MLNQETAKAARTDSGYILRAPRRMRVADAVAQYMRVPMGAGNSVPWDPLVAPYVIEPMNCLASREYDAVIFVGPARTGKTIGLIDGWVIYNVICDPADMLIIQMTEEKAREHSKKRLARTFRVSPEVVSRLSPNKNDNNVYDRTFLAGNYLKIGWPSVNIMSSSDYKCVALTDYDRFPEDIDGEGDAFSLASKRTTTFMSSGMTLVESSPLAMQIPAFRQKLSDGWYQVRIAGRDAGETELSARLNEPLANGAVIHIVPRLAGAKSGGVFQVVLGAALIAVAWWNPVGWLGAAAVSGMYAAGASMILGGVAQMLAPKARTPTAASTDNGKQNTYFSSLDNMVAQGNVLPVLYGEMRVGSRVVSQEISTADEGDGGQVVVIGR